MKIKRGFMKYFILFFTLLISLVSHANNTDPYLVGEQFNITEKEYEDLKNYLELAKKALETTLEDSKNLSGDLLHQRLRYGIDLRPGRYEKIKWNGLTRQKTTVEISSSEEGAFQVMVNKQPANEVLNYIVKPYFPGVYMFYCVSNNTFIEIVSDRPCFVGVYIHSYDQAWLWSRNPRLFLFDPLAPTTDQSFIKK